MPYHIIPYPYYTLPYHTTPYHTIPYQAIPYQSTSCPVPWCGHCFFTSFLPLSHRAQSSITLLAGNIIPRLGYGISTVDPLYRIHTWTGELQWTTKFHVPRTYHDPEKTNIDPNSCRCEVMCMYVPGIVQRGPTLKTCRR